MNLVGHAARRSRRHRGGGRVGGRLGRDGRGGGARSGGVAAAHLVVDLGVRVRKFQGFGIESRVKGVRGGG